MADQAFLETDETPCTCKHERSFQMIVWGRHYEGCAKVRRWPQVAVPLTVLIALALAACGTLETARPIPTRCLNKIGWNGRAYTTLPEQWVADSFCHPIPKEDPRWRCAAADTRNEYGYGEVSYRWASCDMTRTREEK